MGFDQAVEQPVALSGPASVVRVGAGVFLGTQKLVGGENRVVFRGMPPPPLSDKATT